MSLGVLGFSQVFEQNFLRNADPSRDSGHGPWSRPQSGNGFMSNGGNSGPPIFNAPVIVLWLIGFLFVAHILFLILPDQISLRLGYYGAVSIERFLAGPAENGGLLRMLAPLMTHMALHADFMHLIFNSIWLLAFGTPVARRMINNRGRSEAFSSVCFLLLFIASGAAGALFHILINIGENNLLIGASGGVSGLLGALIRTAFGRSASTTNLHTLRPSPYVSLFDQRILAVSAVIVATNIFMAFYGGSAGGGGVSWEAHVGGYLFGLIAFPFFDRLGERN